MGAEIIWTSKKLLRFKKAEARLRIGMFANEDDRENWEAYLQAWRFIKDFDAVIVQHEESPRSSE